ncbi:glucosaminidase domain-containing protein [Deminuibacter soli]|uniref:Muramidase n=1 Tax=Deminuibacter soli TaxID=2291815 RepID=A0A3E1NHU1_9BACT|nr:glucosaminidase domain-containing protein [Deminuibacter soli]RFM27452.1 muramidase [Deminuibacter soli]
MKYLILVFLVVSAFFCPPVNAQQHKYLVRDYVNEHTDKCKELSQSYGIPASIIIGTAIVESGAGSSRNAQLLNNHFGIVGKNKLAQRNPPIKTKYKQFESVDASYEAFCKILSRRKYYQTLKDDRDYSKWVSAISAAGYSTTPDVWKQKMMHTIKKYHLTNLDN